MALLQLQMMSDPVGHMTHMTHLSRSSA